MSSKCRLGGPQQSWRRSYAEELRQRAARMKLTEIGQICHNRVRWRGIVTALCYIPKEYRGISQIWKASVNTDNPIRAKTDSL